MANRFVFELDVDPPEISASRAVDYAGRLIGTFRTTPLFSYVQWGGPVRAGLISHVESHFGGQEWTFYNRKGPTWAFAPPFTCDYLVKLLSPRSAAHLGPAQRFLLQEVLSVACTRSRVRLTLRRRIPFLPEILSSDAFASIDANGGEVHLGPYSLASRRQGSVVALTKNAVGRQLYPNGPEDIFFIVTRSPEDGVRLFERGLIDATCNPNLPPAAVKRYQSTHHLRHSPLAMAGVLVPRRGRHSTLAAQTIRRRRICDSVGEGLLPLYNLMDIFDNSVDSERAKNSAAPAEDLETTAPAQLTIAYADFLPNGQVVTLIAEDLMEATGANVVIRALSYAAYLKELQEPTADFIYTLIQPALSEPTTFLEQLLCRWATKGASRTPKAPHEFQGSYLERVAACRAILDSSANGSFIIPVVQLTSKCLVSDVARDLQLSSDGLLRPPLNFQEAPCQPF